MLYWIRNELKHTGIDESTIRQLELASEEAIVNVITHGYKENEGSIDIDIHTIPQNLVEIVIQDGGSFQSFND